MRRSIQAGAVTLVGLAEATPSGLIRRGRVVEATATSELRRGHVVEATDWRQVRSGGAACPEATGGQVNTQLCSL